MPVIVIVITSAASNLRRLPIYQRHNGMVRKTPALDTVIVDYIA